MKVYTQENSSAVSSKDFHLSCLQIIVQIDCAHDVLGNEFAPRTLFCSFRRARSVGSQLSLIPDAFRPA